MGKPYYKTSKGLRFECTDCGNCCTRPGPVYFSEPDLTRAAAFLKMSPGVFKRRFRLRPTEGMLALDPGPQAPCPFHDPDTGCTIYKARPTQCRTWPFWSEVVQRRGDWESAARDCEGMNQGRRYPVREIEAALDLCEEMDLPEGDPWQS